MRVTHTQAFHEPIARPFRGQEATTALTSHSVQLSATRNGYTRGDSRSSPLEDPARLRRAAEVGGAGVWEWHVTAGEIHVNAELASLLGLGAYALKLPTSQFLDVVHGEDTALLRIALQEASKSDQDWSQEFRLRREDNGAVVWICVQGRVVERGDEGEASVMAGLGFDVTGRRRALEHHELLNRELSHRMKNLLSVVSSLVSMTAERRPEAQDFVTAFQARLRGLTAAHELLFRADWRHVALQELVAQTLAAPGVGHRIDIETQDVCLNAHDTQTVVLVLHELATNAMKYGALSSANGNVRVVCDLVAAEDRSSSTCLRIVWEETGGPLVSAPLAKGFGITLIERLTRRQEAAEPVLQWRPEGLRCSFTLAVTTGAERA